MTGGDGNVESHLIKHMWAFIYSLSLFVLNINLKEFYPIIITAFILFIEGYAYFFNHRNELTIEKGNFSHLDGECIGNTAITCLLLTSSILNQTDLLTTLLMYFPFYLISTGTIINATCGLGFSVDGDFINIFQEKKTYATKLSLIYCPLLSFLLCCFSQPVWVLQKYMPLISIYTISIFIYVYFQTKNVRNRPNNEKITNILNKMQEYDIFVNT
jgi:hypothetical protein